MTKSTKSIFEKRYISQAQAIKAAEKELDAGSWQVGKEGTMWQVFKLEAPVMADDLPANAEEMDFPLHPELAAAEAQMPWLKDEQEKADKLAHALQVNAQLPADKPRLSTTQKPTKKVWNIADTMPKASRKEVIAECVRQGIAYGTARTQYQAWFKASQDCMRGDIRKPYEKA